MINSSAPLCILTDVSSSPNAGVGEVVVVGTKSYRYVKVLQTASQAIVAGDVLVYATLGAWESAVVSSDASADGGAVPIGAGVAINAITAAQGTAGVYTWIQIGGAATLSNAVSSGAAGKQITASATDKVAALRANAYDTVLGFMINTTTGVVLQCPGSGF